MNYITFPGRAFPVLMGTGDHSFPLFTLITMICHIWAQLQPVYIHTSTSWRLSLLTGHNSLIWFQFYFMNHSKLKEGGTVRQNLLRFEIFNCPSEMLLLPKLSICLCGHCGFRHLSALQAHKPATGVMWPVVCKFLHVVLRLVLLPYYSWLILLLWT